MRPNTFIGYPVAISNKAVLFQDHFWHGPEWLPFSQIEFNTAPDTNEASVDVAGWLCKKRGLQEFTEVKNDG